MASPATCSWCISPADRLLLRLHRFALRLRPFLPWFYASALAGAAVAAILLFLPGSAHSAQALAIALGISVWALLFYACIRLFQTIPPPVLPKDTRLERLWSRCRLLLYQVLALAVIVLALVLIAMTLKLLGAVSA